MEANVLGFNDEGKGTGKAAKGKTKDQSAPKGQQKGYNSGGYNNSVPMFVPSVASKRSGNVIAINES